MTISQSFTKTFELHKLADSFSIEKKAQYTINISNIRYNNGQLEANASNAYETITTVNDTEISSSNGGGSSDSKNITSAFDNITEFTKAFNIIADSNTSIRFTVNVQALPDNAPQTIKDFYTRVFSEKPLQDLLKAAEQEVTKKKQQIKIEGKLKQLLMSDVMKYINENTVYFKAMTRGLLGVAFFLLTMINSTSIALALNISAPIVLAVAVLGLFVSPLLAIKMASGYRKQKANVLSKLGELENENIDTPENKKKLISKLITIMDNQDGMKMPTFLGSKGKVTARESDYSDAIEIGQQSFTSYSVQLKSFFMPSAYHEGYYVGQELAAKRISRPA
jgi:hypothetical protein